MRSPGLVAILAVAVGGGLLALAPQEPADPGPVGYTDTPQLPDSAWRVHDKHRPVPPVVDPGHPGTVEAPGQAPSDAIVLFDGSSLDAWEGGDWVVEDGTMTVNGTGSLTTKQAFGDVQLHLEWRAPDEPDRSSQGKGNSGVFLMGRYEIQVLNSWQNRTYADGQAAALYGQKPPDANVMRPTGAWQTYDVVFHAPRFDEDGGLIAPARATVLHNGVLVQDHVAFLGPTRHRSLPEYRPHADKLPIQLQDHGNQVSFRNVWVRELGD